MSVRTVGGVSVRTVRNNVVPRMEPLEECPSGRFEVCPSGQFVDGVPEEGTKTNQLSGDGLRAASRVMLRAADRRRSRERRSLWDAIRPLHLSQKL